MHEPLTLNSHSNNKRLSDSVYQTLLEAIFSGKLSPGDVVSEVALAGELGISRTPVHDAIREMAKDGLVLQEANRRPVIAGFNSEDIFDIFEMRKLLEGEAAYKATLKIDRPALTRLRDTVQQLLETPEDPNWMARWAEHDQDFHVTLAKATGSKRLNSDIARYHMLHHAINRSRASVEVLQQAGNEHLQILNAMEKRDPEQARQAMVAHIQEWQAFFVQQFKLMGAV